MKKLIVIVIIFLVAENDIFSKPPFYFYPVTKFTGVTDFKIHTPSHYLLCKREIENSYLRYSTKEINHDFLMGIVSSGEAKQKKLVRVFLTSTILFISLSQLAHQNDNKALGISFASCGVISSTAGLIIYIKESRRK